MANYWKLFVGDLHSCNDHWPPCNSNLLVEALVSKVVYCIGIRLYPRQQHFGVVFPWTRFPLIVKTFNCWQSASRYTRCYHDMGICWPQPLVAIIQGQFNKMVQHLWRERYFVHTDQPTIEWPMMINNVDFLVGDGNAHGFQTNATSRKVASVYLEEWVSNRHECGNNERYFL